MPLVPTRVKEKVLRPTDRMWKHGLLAMPDSNKLEKVIDNDKLRKNLINNALDSIYCVEVRD